MATRNFWMSASIDGRTNRATGGPANKDGGMEIKVYQRDKGEITIPITIECYANAEGQLRTTVQVEGHAPISVYTER